MHEHARRKVKHQKPQRMRRMKTTDLLDVPTLTRRERLVLILRFGLDFHGKRTLPQVAKVINRCTARVRQIQFAAMGKIRDELDLTAYDAK